MGDIRAALGEAARVLRPDGRVVAVHSGAEDESNDITQAMAPLDPLRRARVDVAERVAEAASAAGLAKVSSSAAAPLSHSATPRTIAAGIRERLWSYLWRIDDQAWQDLAEPAIAAVEALPGQDEPREFVQRHWLTVLSR